MSKKVAIIYNYIAHYRVPIFNVLSQNEDPYYKIFAGVKTEIPIKTANQKLKNLSPKEGGLNWGILANSWFFKYFLWQRGVIRLCYSEEFDSIIFLGNMYYISTWIGALLARLKGKKVIFWTHGFIKQEKNIKGFIRSLFYRLAHEILTYGHRAKDILISKGFNTNRIKVVYNSLDYDNQVKFRGKNITAKKPLFSQVDKPTFGYIGRLTKQKNLDLLIRVLQRLRENGNQANLLIIGEGEESERLYKMVQTLGLEDCVIFYGACYEEEEICKLMNEINVIVSPGEVGLTAIHAMTYGVPVITHNCFEKQMPEFEVIIEGKTGSFFDYNNPEDSLVDALQLWLFNKSKKYTEKECFKVIDEYYNPAKQKEIFNSAV